jgi:hypothetical protein
MIGEHTTDPRWVHRDGARREAVNGQRAGDIHGGGRRDPSMSFSVSRLWRRGGGLRS